MRMHPVLAAIRVLAASSDSIQTRLMNANESILLVTIDEFDGDLELRIKFARILDLLAVDQDDIERIAVETAAPMSDSEAVKVADLICDFLRTGLRHLEWIPNKMSENRNSKSAGSLSIGAAT